MTSPPIVTGTSERQRDWQKRRVARRPGWLARANRWFFAVVVGLGAAGCGDSGKDVICYGGGDCGSDKVPCTLLTKAEVAQDLGEKVADVGFLYYPDGGLLGWANGDWYNDGLGHGCSWTGAQPNPEFPPQSVDLRFDPSSVAYDSMLAHGIGITLVPNLGDSAFQYGEELEVKTAKGVLQIAVISKFKADTEKEITVARQAMARL